MTGTNRPARIRLRAFAGLLWPLAAGVALVFEFATGCRGVAASAGWCGVFGATVWLSWIAWASTAWTTKSITGDPEFERLGVTVGAVATVFLLVHTALVWWPAVAHGQAVARVSITHFVPTFLGVGVYVVGLVTLALQLELGGRQVGRTFGGEGGRRLVSALAMGVSLLFFVLAIHHLGVLATGRPLFGDAS